MSSSSAASHSNPVSASHSHSGRTAPRNPHSHPSTSTPLFTPLMQDAQARNKNPYESESSDSEEESPGRKLEFYGHESYEAVQRRREAAIILDSLELLMMHAQARNDSIPGTRYYFTKMLCGYLDEGDEYEKKIRHEHEKKKGKEKEKEKDGEKGRGKVKRGRVSGQASGSGERS